MKIGVLAIQGDFAAHARALAKIGVLAVEIRRADELMNLDGLIIPGGESTTMLKFVQERGKPIFGTCAGAILLARDVQNPPQASLGLIDIAVARNAYGRQVDSFISDVDSSMEGGPLEAVFIRAPRILRVGPEVEIIARHGDEPVMVREKNILAATFHPELTADERVHRLFSAIILAS